MYNYFGVDVTTLIILETSAMPLKQPDLGTAMILLLDVQFCFLSQEFVLDSSSW